MTILARGCCALMTTLAVASTIGCGGDDGGGDGPYGPNNFIGAMSGTSATGLVSGTFWIDFDSDWEALGGNMSMQGDSGAPEEVVVGGAFTQEGMVEDGVFARGFRVSAGSLVGDGALFRFGDDDFSLFSVELTGPNQETCTLQGLRAPAGGEFYCGRYAGDATGTWNFVIVDGRISGTFGGEYSGTLSGSRTGSSVSIQWSAGLGGGGATGTVSGTAVRGTWSGSGLAGSWQTDSTACPPPPSPPPPPRD